MKDKKRTARLAGLLFLLMVVFGLLAEIYFRQKIFVSGDAVVTAANIVSNELVYRMGIVFDLLMSLFYLLTALALYRLLGSVEKNLAALMVVLAAAGSIILMINVRTELMPLLILSGSEYLGTLNPGQLKSLALLYFISYEHGYMIGQIFFALWVLPLGILIYRSKFIPKAFGVLFIVQAVFGLLSVPVHFLMPSTSVDSLFLLPGVIAEFAFLFWLLIAGVRVPKSKMPEMMVPVSKVEGV